MIRGADDPKRCTAIVVAVFFLTQLRITGAMGQAANGGNVVFGEAILPRACGNHFFVSTINGYSVIERLNGAPVIQRDQLNGAIQTIGKTELTDTTQHSKLLVDVEDTHLSQQQLNTRMLRLCR